MRQAGTDRPRVGVSTRGDSVWSPGIVMLILAVAVTGARLLAVGHGDISRFVVAGRAQVDPSAAPPDLHVFPGGGYDGQFAYRLALAPYDLRVDAHGIVIDSPLRLQRIAYPTLSWLVAAGRSQWVAAALVAVNILALAALGLLGGILARDHGRRPLWGLLLAGFPGFLFSLSRDLTEIVAAVGVVAGLLAWRRHRPTVAGMAFTVAVLARETALLAVVAMAVGHLAAWRRGVSRPCGARVWALPIITFGLWQLVCVWKAHGVPMLAGTGDNIVAPLTGLFPSAVAWFGDVTRHPGAMLPTLLAILALLQLAALGVTAGLAVARLHTTTGPTGPTGTFEVRVGFVLALLLAISLSGFVLRTPASFRQLVDLHVFAAVVLLGTDGRLRIPAAVLAAAWVGTALAMTVVV